MIGAGLRPGPGRRPAAGRPRVSSRTVAPRPGPPPGRRPAPPRSRPARSGTPGSSPARSARPQNTSCPSARPPDQVPRPVHPLTRPERTGHEPLRRQPRPAQVAPGQPAPRRCTAPPPPPPAPAPAPRPARTPACSRSARRSAGPRSPSSARHAQAVESTDVSVGPYRLCSTGPNPATNRDASAARQRLAAGEHPPQAPAPARLAPGRGTRPASTARNAPSSPTPR